MRFDDSAARFRGAHPEESFSGASGVLFEQAMAQTRMAVTLADPNQPDMPLVFANRAFRALTGYAEEEIIGRNCRFLQGPETSSQTLDRVRRALEKEDVVVVELLNYRKDGSSFWNALHIGPIYNAKGDLVYFFGSQWDVSDVRAARDEERQARLIARELSHRMKNMFSVISGIVNITGRTRGVRDEAAEINSRIHALGRAYETTLDDATMDRIDIAEAIHATLDPYAVDRRRLAFKGTKTKVPFATISVVSILLHELANNAVKYGAWSNDTGQVVLDWHCEETTDELIIDWRETGGPPLDARNIEPGAGSAIIERLLGNGRGRIEREFASDGLKALISIPLKGT